MKYIVDVSEWEDAGPEELEEVRSALEDSIAVHVDVEEYHEPAAVAKALLYDPPSALQRAWQDEDKVELEGVDELLSANTMLYVNGSQTSFRCGCGSNVFSKFKEPDGREYYECHGCWTIYRGEK